MRVGVGEGDADSIVDKVGIEKVILDRIDEIVIVLCGARLGHHTSVCRLTVDKEDRRSSGRGELVKVGREVAILPVILVVEVATQHRLRVWVDRDVEVGGVAGVDENRDRRVGGRWGSRGRGNWCWSS